MTRARDVGGTGGVLLCLCVAVGRSGRLPPCASRGEMRDARWSSSLWVSKGDGADGDIRRRRRQSRLVGCSGGAETSARSLPSGALGTPWLLSTGWSYHFLWAATKQRVVHVMDWEGAVPQASAPGTGEKGGIGSEPRLVAAVAGTRAAGGSGRSVSGLVGTSV